MELLAPSRTTSLIDEVAEGDSLMPSIGHARRRRALSVLVLLSNRNRSSGLEMLAQEITSCACLHDYDVKCH